MADPAPTAIELEAARWLALLDEPGLDRERVAKFRAWLAADARHKHAYEALSTTSDRIDAYLARQPTREAAERLHFMRRRPKGRPIWALAGAFAVACIIILALVRVIDPFNAANAETYATPAGHERALRLADGSELVMGPGARLRVALSSAARPCPALPGRHAFQCFSR
jgi:transmembrane sensor